ncbi:VOC family protein [Novosphingobium aquae]|uniref:VOC family protein n=1 Tax=Novosphingobium aquae TaxID=3133435 RepID=A0ABU8SCY2_9SPHN
MTALGLDHVNILTEDLPATIAFYNDVLGLISDPTVLAGIGMAGTWLRDPEGRPIVHVVVKDGTRSAYDTYIVGQPTGAVHHVAFRCRGFDETIARLRDQGLDIAVNDGNYNLRQIVLTDPNGILVEMNFPGD